MTIRSTGALLGLLEDTLAGGFAVKVAVTVFAASIVTVHTPLAFVHAPLQPVKLEPAAGVAVKVTTVA